MVKTRWPYRVTHTISGSVKLFTTYFNGKVSKNWGSYWNEKG
jgi:hypothetical protein